MSSIGSNIPNAGNEMRIEGDRSPKDAKKAQKQRSASELALKALGDLKDGLSSIDLKKHLGNLKQLSSGLNKLSMSLFAKILPKPKKNLPPLMSFEGMDQGSVKKSQLKDVFSKLVKSQKSEVPINLMDQDMKAHLDVLHDQVEQSNQELNKTLSQIALKRNESKGSGGDIAGIPAGLPKIKVKAQEGGKTESNTPKTPRFQINSQKTTSAASSSIALKEAASKLKLGGDFKAGLKTILQNAKKQIDDNQGEAKQIKKKLGDVKDVLQTAQSSGVVDNSSAKALLKNLNFFDQMTEKNIRSFDEMKKNVDDWSIPVNYNKLDVSSPHGTDSVRENGDISYDDLLRADDGATDILPK